MAAKCGKVPLGVAAGLAILLFPLIAQQEELARLYNEARASEAAGDYPAATQRYERIVALRPDMAEAYANLGNLYYVQGQAEQATASFKKAIRLKPGLFAPHLLLGVLDFNAHEFERAVQHLTAATKLDPSSTLANLYLGYTNYALLRHAQSAEFLEKVVQQDPNNPDAWYHLSKVNSQLSKHYLETLQKRHPESIQTFLARSHFHESSGSWAAAQEELSRALAKEPDNKRLKQRMDWLARRAAGDTSDPPADADDLAAGATRYFYSSPAGPATQRAIAAEKIRIRESRKVKPQTPQSLYQLAEGYQALSFLSSLWVLQANPDSYRAHQLKAQSYEAAGHLEEAVTEYREVLVQKPDLQTIHFAIGNLYWRRARLDEALAELREELKVSPNDPQAHYEIGDILFSQEKSDEAEKHFEQAIRYEPSMAEAHLAIERIANAKGNFEKALAHLKKAAEITPDDPTPYYRMWVLYRRLGKPAEAQIARAAFEKRKTQGGSQNPVRTDHFAPARP